MGRRKRKQREFEFTIAAIQGRQRIRNQLHTMAPGEYYPVVIAARLTESGREVKPILHEAGRKQQVALPDKPLVGEVTGLGVAGEQGVLLRFEMQATKGSGRIVPLGSIQRVMRESIEAAGQYIHSHYEGLGIAADWRSNFDVAVLATMMGVPKEGPSAGVAMVTGIVSALKNVPVRHDVAQAIEHFAQGVLSLRRIFGHQGQVGSHEGPLIITYITEIGFSVHALSLPPVAQSA